jgi:hypothetical protein
MVVKTDKGYEVRSKDGKLLGTYDSKEKAEKRLRQIEFFKHVKKPD